MIGGVAQRARQFASMVDEMIEAGLLTVTDGAGAPNIEMTVALREMARSLEAMLISDDVLTPLIKEDS